MTAVACLLPLLIAQQMLDVVAAKMKAGQIKTNPAAVLRGIARKYHQNPASFDPSVGFGIAESRQRRADSERQLQRALEARDPVPLPPRQNGPRVRPAGLERLLEVSRQVLGRSSHSGQVSVI